VPISADTSVTDLGEEEVDTLETLGFSLSREGPALVARQSPTARRATCRAVFLWKALSAIEPAAIDLLSATLLHVQDFR
jgi:hypothetical protein